MAGRTGELAADFWPRCPLAGRYQRQPAIRGDKCCLRPQARMGFRGGHWPVDCRHANLVSARTSENQLRFSCLEVSVLRRRPTTTSSSYHPRFSKPQKWAVDRKSAPTTLPIYAFAAAPASCSICRKRDHDFEICDIANLAPGAYAISSGSKPTLHPRKRQLYRVLERRQD